MKNYQTLIGLSLVAVSIVVSSLILQSQEEVKQGDENKSRPLNKVESSKVEVETEFKSYTLESIGIEIPSVKMTGRDKDEYYKNKQAKDCLTLKIYNGNANVTIKTIDLKIDMTTRPKAKGIVDSKSRTYRAIVNCPPLACKTIYVQCAATPSYVHHSKYDVRVVSMTGANVKRAAEN